MSGSPSHAVLRARILAVRRKMAFHAAIASLIQVASGVFLFAAVGIATDQRWAAGRYSGYIAGGAACLLLLYFLYSLFRNLRSPLASAIALDGEARLKDRISTAWEFLNSGQPLDEPRRLQVEDAIRHAETLNLKPLFRLRFPRMSYLLPVFVVLLVLSFLVPPQISPLGAGAAAAALQKDQQLLEIQRLQEELKEELKDEDLAEVLQQLKEIERRFSEGEMQERDLMIELARLDEQLRQQMAAMGVEALDAEVGAITPHLFASDASRAVAQALKQGQLDKAAEEMQKLAQRVEKGEVAKEKQKELARNMGVAASKLGESGQNSFSGDLSAASGALNSSDAKSFNKSSKSMGDKLQKLQKYRNFSKTAKSLAMCKACLGQPKFCLACNGQGCGSCNGLGLGLKLGQGKGGLKAGRGSADPLGDATRTDSYREMLKVTGMAGGGPVESETEMTAGETSESQLEAKELYSEYAAIAEQAIDSEEIPLSHRYHVKRYFQTIRPAE